MVLEAAVTSLGNPVVLRMALVLLVGALAFALGTILIRRLRRSLTHTSFQLEETDLGNLALPAYQAVIQELKQQKHELESTQQAERRRAKTSENISAAVLSHLSSGVLFITPNGLVRQANSAARQILGFASIVGMNAAQIFRDAAVLPVSDTTLAEMVEASLRDKSPFRRWHARYLTPGGHQRVLDITVTSVHSPSGDALGAACVVNDQTELASIREEQDLHGEISAEMALELRNSLATIADRARQLATDYDSEKARQAASDIAAEAAQLQSTIGGFLAGARATAAGN